jgi:predicted phosphodiesterase
MYLPPQFTTRKSDDRPSLTRRDLLRKGLSAAAGASVLAALGCRGEAIPRHPIADSPRRGGTDVTFLVGADTHLGFAGLDERNRRQIEAMNRLPGGSWPGDSDRLAQPRALLVAGDLTENGKTGEMEAFASLYGHKSEGQLDCPTRVFAGNHDRYVPAWYLGIKPVHGMIRNRHGAMRYSWDWDDVHLVALGEYPDDATCRWLARDLAQAGRERPVVLLTHYGILGPYSDWWSDQEKSVFGDVIEPFNVAAIFHGHYHNSDTYTWRGHRVYNVGSPKHSMHSFAAVRITDHRLSVASYNWGRGDWQWADSGAINQAASSP